MRGSRIAAVLVLASAIPIGGAPARAAQTTPLELVEQTAFVEPEGELVARLQVTGAPPGAQVRWVVHQRVRNRSEFTRSITGEGLRTALLDRVAPVEELTSGADTVVVRIPIRATGSDSSRLRLTAAGVYPVQLELLDGRGAAIAGLVTYLVRLPDAADESPPLSVALVMPIHADPALQPDGTVKLDGSRRAVMAITAAALLNHPDVPLTLAVTPETIDALAESGQPGDSELLASLRDAVRGRPVLGLPYVRIPTAAFVARALDDELVAGLTRGVDVLTDQLGAAVDRDTWIGDETLDNETVAALARLGVDRFVVPDGSVSAVDERRFPVTLTQGFELGPDRGPRAAQADSGLGSHLLAEGQPVLAAHVLLADLATLYFDAPSLSRGAVIVPPVGWVPAPGLLDALLAGLAPNAIIDPVDVQTWFGSVPVATATGPRLPSADATDDPLVRELEPQPAPSVAGYAARLSRARADARVYGSMIGPNSARADPLERRILVSGASGFTATRRLRYLDAVAEFVTTELAAVHAPERQTITLTARTGRIPIVVRNEAGYPLAVRLEFDSDRVEFPDHAAGLPLTLTDEITRVEVPVRTRGPGDSPIDVVITSPDGRREIASTRYQIRSTAVSGVGLVLSIGAGVFLLLWWARDVRRTRRHRRELTDKVPAP